MRRRAVRGREAQARLSILRSVSLSLSQARAWLGRYGCTGDQQHMVMSQLSDGQKARIVFAKLAMDKPHLLMLDEPTNHLDMESIDSLARMINCFKAREERSEKNVRENVRENVSPPLALFRTFPLSDTRRRSRAISTASRAASCS